MICFMDNFLCNCLWKFVACLLFYIVCTFIDEYVNWLQIDKYCFFADVHIWQQLQLMVYWHTSDSVLAIVCNSDSILLMAYW